MSVASPESVRDDLVRLLHRGNGVHDFALGAARILAGAVPFDGICLVAMDPTSLLPTAEVTENGLPPEAIARMAGIELQEPDVNKFVDLASAATHVASLSAATAGVLDRSVRHRELRGPNGFGDELRAALVVGSGTWGGLTLLRGDDTRCFTRADTDLVESVTHNIAEGVRRATLFAASVEDDDGDETAGLMLLAPDDSVAKANAAARRWLEELQETAPAVPVPSVLTAVASRARGIASGEVPPDGLAWARVRMPSGRLLMVHASVLGDDSDALTAVVLERAQPHNLAPLLADAYGLTDRERAVTRLVALGLPTETMAQRLHLSSWTIQDHLKSIFQKLGVRTRGELVAQVYFGHRPPHLGG